MAVKSTKRKSTTRTKKKPTVKKTTTKRRTRKRKKKSNLKKNIFVFFGVLFIISLVAFGYFLGNNDNSSKHKTLQNKTSVNEQYNTKELLHDLSKIKVIEPKVIKKEKPAVKYVEIKKVEKKPLKEKEHKRVEKKKQKQETKKVILTAGKGKPRLVIVIDDVSSAAQMKRIQGTGLKLTPSIFPPSELSMTSHKLADPLEHYMIHLPMESGNTQLNTQYKTLLVNNSTYTIEQRIKEIRRLFPNAKYVNNHTGSIFTDDYEAMYKLYKALDKQGFVFIDSRTVSSTKVSKVAREFDHMYISRDIFIDNEHNIPYIHKKLKEAVAIAKKKGYAIAIGHPHKITMEALYQAKAILDDVEVVYIDDIFKK